MGAEATERQHYPDGTVGPGQRPSLPAILRGFGVAFGPTLLLEALGAASILAVLSGRAFVDGGRPARLVRSLAVLGSALPWVYALLLRPWHLRWGATDQETEKLLPGDELVPDAGIVSTRAITVNAPPERVWPWIAQIGQDRGGFYSYEWLENLAGCRMRNADRVHPEWQRREVGETVFLHPATGLKVASFEPGRAIVLENWGAFVVEPLGEESARVIIRSRVPRGPGALFYLLSVEIPHFIMERRMLKGIKERAEALTDAVRA